MEHDNYNPDSEPLQIRTDLRNIVDGYYVVYSKNWKSGPSILSYERSRWRTQDRMCLLSQSEVERFTGIIGPIPKMK
jgi:hypothetical protein